MASPAILGGTSIILFKILNTLGGALENEFDCRLIKGV